jgi:hypothetical protein
MKPIDLFFLGLYGSLLVSWIASKLVRDDMNEEHYMQPGQKHAHDPIVQLANGKWTFCDETWNYIGIEYDTRAAAEDGLAKYCDWLEYGDNPPPGQAAI